MNIYGILFTKEEKIDAERNISEFKYKSTLEWKFMKRIKSDTSCRAWHIKVGDNHYRLIQNRVARYGEILSAIPAGRGGSVQDYSHPVFDKPGEDWLIGLEYLLRSLEGQDISKLKL
jgi:hypothetical protein